MSKSRADILIVDDEADIRSLIVVGILEDEGYGTGQAESASQVYNALSKAFLWFGCSRYMVEKQRV